MPRVLAVRGDQEVEADVQRYADEVIVRIGDVEHRFRVEATSGGRLEMRMEDGTLHVVEVVGTDLRVDGHAYPLEVRKAPPKVAGAMRGAGASGGVTKVKPPMPGKIVKIAVAPGDRVQPGEVLVILEAMKMQNEIVSPVEGTVRAVGVKEGESIDAKKVLCEIE